MRNFGKIFIAGHKGMVGGAVLRLLKANKEIARENILTVSREELDLRCQSDVENWFKTNKPDIVIVAAAKVGGILANSKFPHDFLSDNLNLELNLINSSYKHGVDKLLFLGSSCIYPKFANQPINEDELLSGKLESTNEWYALAKIAGIKLCESLKVQYGFNALSLMPTNLYGPGDNYHVQNSHVLPALIRRFHEAHVNGYKEVVCWGTGKPRREFLHVDDLAKAIFHCIENWEMVDEACWKNKTDRVSFMNVGAGSDISIKELAEMVAAKVGFKGEIKWDESKPDGTPRKLLDITRIRDVGWTPKIELSEGIDATIKDFMNQNQLREA